VALSIEAVAVRAGVAKTTVYRRWPTRLALVAEVLAKANEAWPMPAPHGGSVHDDLLVLYRNWVAGIAGAGRVIPALIAAAIQNAELAELLQRSFVRPRRALAIGIIESAVQRGELPAGTDAATAIDMFMGRMWYRLLITGEGVKAEDETKVVGMLLDGLRRHSTAGSHTS
jgi:AcrR family transcriptional regulator